MDEAVLLLSQYCDSDHSAEDQAKLVEWLKRDAANVERFVRSSLLHSQIQDAIQEHRLQSHAWSHALKEGTSSVDLAVLPSRNQAPVNRRYFWMLSVAALVAVSTTIALWPYLRGPELVAQVTSLAGSAISDSGEPLSAGAFLPAGTELQIVDGDALITFESGAKVFIEAPATFVVTDTSSGSLIRGRLSARVPTQAIGFAVHTSLLDVVDLGTEFHLARIDDHQLDLHVFDGLVEVRLCKEFRHAEDGPLRISEGRSARFDLQANEVSTLKYDESLKRAF